MKQSENRAILPGRSWRDTNQRARTQPSLMFQSKSQLKYSGLQKVNIDAQVHQIAINAGVG